VSAASSHRGSHVLPSASVTFEEVLSNLGARSDVPSTLGNQLEGAESRSMPDRLVKTLSKQRKAMTAEEREHAFWHTITVHDDAEGNRRDEEARIEGRIFARARVLNCIDGLARLVRIGFCPCPDVEAFDRGSKTGQGSIVVSVLRAHEEWRLQSEERGLAAVYEWMRTVQPWLPMPVHDEDSVVQAFRVGKAKVCRRRAAMLVADSLLVMTAWVELWNRKAKHAQSD
jgi:hypothetical protein